MCATSHMCPYACVSTVELLLLPLRSKPFQSISVDLVAVLRSGASK